MKRYVILFVCCLMLVIACNYQSNETQSIDDIVAKQMVFCIATNVGNDCDQSISGVNLVNISSTENNN